MRKNAYVCDVEIVSWYVKLAATVGQSVVAITVVVHPHTISPPNLGNIEIPISVQEPSKMSQKLLLPYRSRTHALFINSENSIAISNI